MKVVVSGLLLLASFAVHGDDATFSELLNKAEQNRLNNEGTISPLLEELEIRLPQAEATEKQRYALLIAQRHALKGDLTRANQLLTDISKNAASKPIYIRALSLKSQIALATGNFADALTNIGDALRALPEVTNPQSRFEVLNVAPRILSAAQEHEKAISYALEALTLAQELNAPLPLCLAARNVTQVMYDKGDYQAALTAADQQLRYCAAVAENYAANAMVYKSMSLASLNQHQQAKAGFVEAIALFEKIGYTIGVIESKVFLAETLLALGENEQAETILLSQLNEIENLQLGPISSTAFETLSVLYENRNDHQKALYYFKKKHQADVYVVDQNKANRSLFLQMQFDSKLKEQQLAHLEERNKILAKQTQIQRDKKTQLQFGVGAVTVICILLMMALHRLRNQSLQLRKLAQIDGLTGLHNRRHALMLAEQLYASCLRRNSPLAVVMVDLDLFKEINDRFGHAAGDEVLRSAARHFASCLRKQDVIGRTGGEEFAIFLPDTDLNAAITVVERCRSGVGEVQEGEQRRTVTASFGIAVASNDRFTLDELLQQADKALYSAKANGRNQVAIARDLAYAASAYDEPASLI